MVKSPNLDKLKKLSNIDNPIKINQIFNDLINELKAYLNLEVVNNTVEISVVEEVNEKSDFDTSSCCYGVSRSIRDGIYYIKLFKNYKNLYPFLLLQSAYLTFVPNNLKETRFIDFAINQFVEIDLQEFTSVSEWSFFVREKYLNYNFILNQSDKFRFDRIFDLEETKASESPKQIFFEYIRRNSNENLDDNQHFILNKIYKEFIFKTSKKLQSNEIAETLRIITKIFYKIKNCDTLEGFSNYFSNFKKQGIIQTDLSLRSFRKNLGWINNYSSITPSYYFDWKAIDIAYIACHLQFNPHLEKTKIDKIINQIPFLIIPKLSIDSFAVELSAYFVIPKIYVKDLINMLEKMENNGYVIKKHCSLAKKYVFSLNLNYFRESYSNGQIIDTNKKYYSKDFEIEFIQNYNKDFNNPNLTLLDFLILERLRFFSFVGIGFSRKKEILNIIKSDHSTFFTGEKSLIKELESCLNTLNKSSKLQKEFLNLLEKNQNLGFFYLNDELEKWEKYFDITNKDSKKNTRLNKFTQFEKLVERENILKSIEGSKIFDYIDSKSFDFENLFLNYSNSNDKYTKDVERIQVFSKFLKLCSNLKIFNINLIKKIINNPKLLNNIIKLKKIRLRELKRSNWIYDVSYSTINLKIDEFINKEPKIIKPYLIATIWTNSVASYFPQMILKNSPKVRVAINKIRKYFPKSYFYETRDLFSGQELIFLQLFVPFLNNSEKITLISIMSKIFKENIISFKRYSWDGFLHTFSRKDFYDFTKKEFFYTKDLFKQYFLYIKSICGEETKFVKEKSASTVKFWRTNKNLIELIKKIRRRVNSENINFNKRTIQELVNFHLNLEEFFMNRDKFEKVKNEKFFKQYIKSIKVFPAFQNFGMGQYFLHIHPFDLNEIDLKMLFTNTFQKIKCSASIDDSNSLFIKYIFPYNEPNTSYINWLRSKNKIREYCLFSVKSISQIVHFNYNLSSNGWYLDSNNFQIYIQTILSSPNYNVQIPKAKNFIVGDLEKLDYCKLDSSYFKALMRIYNWHSKNVKNTSNVNRKSIFNGIQTLIKKKLIFPYIKFKNLGFKEKIHIILLNPKKESIKILKNVFKFFNLGFVYEIEGEYYIHGPNEKKKVFSGLMIKLYLPDCELAEFLSIFEYIFQYLKVERYLIITDLVNGESLIKSVYGNNYFLEKYNPLRNLIWNTKTEKWENHKLFSKTFDYLYPELFFEEKEKIMKTLSP